MWSHSMAECMVEDYRWQGYDDPYEYRVVYHGHTFWQHRIDERRKKYRHAIVSSCPKCRVGPGELCINMSFNNRRDFGKTIWYPHDERKKSANLVWKQIEWEEQDRQNALHLARREEMETAKAERSVEIQIEIEQLMGVPEELPFGSPMYNEFVKPKPPRRR